MTYRDICMTNMDTAVSADFFHVVGRKVAEDKAEAVQREFAASRPSGTASLETEPHPNWSGIYPHLAMFNTPARGECDVGAVAPWADRLWVVTFSPHHEFGSADKLFEIDKGLNIPRSTDPDLSDTNEIACPHRYPEKAFPLSH